MQGVGFNQFSPLISNRSGRDSHGVCFDKVTLHWRKSIIEIVDNPEKFIFKKAGPKLYAANLNSMYVLTMESASKVYANQGLTFFCLFARKMLSIPVTALPFGIKVYSAIQSHGVSHFNPLAPKG